MSRRTNRLLKWMDARVHAFRKRGKRMALRQVHLGQDAGHAVGQYPAGNGGKHLQSIVCKRWRGRATHRLHRDDIPRGPNLQRHGDLRANYPAAAHANTSPRQFLQPLNPGSARLRPRDQSPCRRLLAFSPARARLQPLLLDCERRSAFMRQADLARGFFFGRRPAEWRLVARLPASVISWTLR